MPVTTGKTPVKVTKAVTPKRRGHEELPPGEIDEDAADRAWARVAAQEQARKQRGTGDANPV